MRVPSASTPAGSAVPLPEAAAVPQDRARTVVFVAGSGRSGTSTLAGILRELGLYIPQPEVVPDATNPRGFAEPQWLVDFHTELLRRTNVQVSDARPRAWFEAGRPTAREGVRQRATDWLSEQFAEHDEVVLKDPRLAWFLGLWRVAAIRAGATPCFATMLRPPTEVVGSKQKYYNNRMGDAHGTAAWVNMMLHTERSTRGSKRVFVRYDELLDDWTTSLVRTGDELDLARVKVASADRMRKVHNFIDPSLHRVRLTWDDVQVPAPLRDLAAATWDQLNLLADPDVESAPVHAELDTLREAYSAYYEEAEAVVYSSLLAARRSGQPAAQPTPPGSSSSIVARLVDRIPHDQRAKIPPSVRRGVRRVLSHRGGQP
ncbi:sulfotransferase family protein [Solicola gregarius]|uniref:Sulfotransferase family protein n=1 Tax=Solicola gregarius TaxID=2908642 RepID=A0AA46TN72_9ACTN|nr:sulfotransferase family protein [Solicola gregarius]UYM07448.1 sulfotransferase family protein [Solicola gregarius]